jgi:hypothetical protein
MYVRICIYPFLSGRGLRVEARTRRRLECLPRQAARGGDENSALQDGEALDVCARMCMYACMYMYIREDSCMYVYKEETKNLSLKMLRHMRLLAEDIFQN